MDLPESTHQWWLDLVECCATTGYLLHASISVRTDEGGWLLANAEILGSEIQFLGPRRRDYEEQPGWDLLVDLAFTAPMSVAVLHHLMLTNADMTVSVPNLLVKGGWCRTPVRNEAIEIALIREGKDG